MPHFVEVGIVFVGGTIEIYKWINPLFISFQLGAFVLISGYLYQHSSVRLISWTKFIWKKFKRLMIPCILFSLIYYYLLSNKGLDVWNLTLNLLSGVGHLWFLPMLFGCFVSCFFIGKLRFSKWIILVSLAVLSLLPLPIPFGIGNACHYLVYFYLGVVLYNRKDEALQWNKKYIVILWLVYLFSTVFLKFIGHDYLFSYIDLYGIYSKLVVLVINNAIQLLITITGSLALYSTVVKAIHGKSITNGALLFLGKSSYGIYIFHQFILVLLYYHTSLSSNLSPYLIPWFGLIVSLILSMVCTYFMLRTKVGRFLID